MKTNKLPQSVWSDSQEAGSQSQQNSQSNRYYLNGSNGRQTSYASNDASYNHDVPNDNDLKQAAKNTSMQDSNFGYKSANTGPLKTKESVMLDSPTIKNKGSTPSVSKSTDIANGYYSDGYKQTTKLAKKEPMLSGFLEDHAEVLPKKLERKGGLGQNISSSSTATHTSYQDIPERIFMNGLIKHTGIALAIIIPLAAFSAYAATPPVNTSNSMGADATTEKTTTEMLSIEPSAIIHKSASTPTTVDHVDLNKYTGTWYEIGRLPMYFQRNCAGDVTANYTKKTDGSGIIVTNKCVDKDGSSIVAEGLAKPVDESGSKLKVTFLPSWLRWLPVGRADYWVLARDADYKTALVGTPDKEYLWLLARSPNVTQETYAKYRQIAQQQGYDLKEFKLTPQTNQTVNLVP
jgi:apolipoprotein D and lipocalin family protein